MVHRWGRGSLLLSCGLTATAAAVELQPPSPCMTKGVYDDWLSLPSAFLRTDQPRGLPGLHVGCLYRGATGTLILETFKDGVRWPEGPEAVELLPQAETSWAAFRFVVAEALGMNEPTNSWSHQEMKQLYGIFSSDTTRLGSVQQAVDAELIFIVNGGQWFWPPVREGFVRQLPQLGMTLETLSVQPVVFQVRGFLKDRECEELVEVGQGRMVNSPVSLMDKDKGKEAKEFRTSTQARVDRSESETLREIDARVSTLTGVPHLHNEEVQLLRYDKTQYYSAHLDNWDPSFYSDSAWFEHGHNNRYITVFWYLTTVEKGGETIFPRAHGLPQPMDMYSCEKGLKVKPVKGSVIFWYSLHPNGNTDPNGLHGACPVELGQKFSANYWVWNKPRSPNPGVDFSEPLALFERPKLATPHVSKGETRSLSMAQVETARAQEAKAAASRKTQEKASAGSGPSGATAGMNLGSFVAPAVLVAALWLLWPRNEGKVGDALAKGGKARQD